ncbi:uncharacterized protein LOC128557893 [Mercenaria mercenaria]|uniref:uncharacterized protein LOC128557893 n=1 Tax=Mercenaria mercenaria TaxID=6596 RepID=UPI00234E6893|nr:uncharacterized protein LOC128557893 [Mercenaria mercenaria]
MSAQDRRLDDYIAEMSKLDLLQGRSTTDEISSKPEEEHTVQKKPRTDINISPVIENYQEHMERIERLYDEINGMFARSRVPKEEQPQCDRQFDGTINDKLKEELRQLSSSIRSCGYRFRSVLVFVDDNCDQEKLKPDIERILKTYNISTFTIVSSSVKELSSCNVGSEVAAVFDDSTVKYGTLGGFGHTSSDEGNNTICLVSRHVVTDTYGNPASTLKVSKGKYTTKASIIVDKPISSKRNTVLDIAAASFEIGDSQFDTMYKTSEEKAAKGRLSEYRLEELKGLPVHICGSKTPMGYGTITVPKVEAVQNSSMNDFIIIEDRDNPRQEKIPFCAEGDSGSIVCADDQENPDNVQLISMVIGEDLWNTGFYHFLNLEEGIKQVK